MKNKILIIILLFIYNTINAQIVNIPDAAFKDRLVNWPSVDTNGDGIFDSDADTNDDGEIQITEAEAVLRLSTIESDINSIEGIQSFINLIEFHFRGDGITSFDISQNTQLELLNCHHIPITTIDVSQNVNLTTLACTYTQITEIDLSNNPNLDKILLRFNSLISLDLTNNPNLVEVNCNYNQITSLDVSQNLNLFDLNCRSNLITSLDVSQNPNIERLLCDDNQLTSLNIKNGNNVIYTKMWAHDNPNLTCIQVDDVTYPSTQVCTSSSGWCKDESAIYNEDCSLGVSEFLNTHITLFPNPIQNILNIEINRDIFICTLKIYDTLGRLVLEEKEDFDQINVSVLKSGLYLIKIETDKGVLTKKIIKE